MTSDEDPDSDKIASEQSNRTVIPTSRDDSNGPEAERHETVSPAFDSVADDVDEAAQSRRPPLLDPNKTVFMPRAPEFDDSSQRLSRHDGKDSPQEAGFLDYESDGSGWDELDAPASNEWEDNSESAGDVAAPYTVFMSAGAISESIADRDRASANVSGNSPSSSDWPERPKEEPSANKARVVSGSQGRISVGVVLNNIYQVKRFIARGGMGEVYEGVNITSDERVAIKVVLSHLAEDSTVSDMFLKEAKTLTRFAHPALVQYRVLAKEPALDILYIVTEFIEGEDLESLIGTIEPTQEMIVALMVRLCSGLQAAHLLGAVHRDMSPDNVLLPGGSIDKAKIIDFGIAKNLDASARTSIGDGFAGKIGFAAPEQFGAFGRKIGPWTDIYSVALVGLAFANRRPVNMGADPFEALERRKQGPDLSALPAPLRPIFAKMLANDPADRPQDMATVLGIFAGLDKSNSVVESKSQTLFGLPKVAALGILGIVGIIVIAGAALWLVSSGSGIDEEVPSETTSDPNTETAVVPAAPVEASMESILSRTSNVIANQSCTFVNASIGTNRSVDLSGAALEPNKLAANLSGVIGDPSVSFNSGKVIPVTSDFCPFVDFIRSARTRPPSGMAAVRVPQSLFTMNGTMQGGCRKSNQVEVITTLQPRQPDFTVLGVVDGESPSVTQLFNSRAGLELWGRNQSDSFKKIGENTYEFVTCLDAAATYGVVLIEGIGPFDIDLPDLSKREAEMKIEDSTWAIPIAEKSKERGWTADSVWYQVK